MTGWFPRQGQVRRPATRRAGDLVADPSSPSTLLPPPASESPGDLLQCDDLPVSVRDEAQESVCDELAENLGVLPH